MPKRLLMLPVLMVLVFSSTILAANAWITGVPSSVEIIPCRPMTSTELSTDPTCYNNQSGYDVARIGLLPTGYGYVVINSESARKFVDIASQSVGTAKRVSFLYNTDQAIAIIKYKKTVKYYSIENYYNNAILVTGYKLYNVP